jgi:hypothetical protein
MNLQAHDMAGTQAVSLAAARSAARATADRMRPKALP